MGLWEACKNERMAGRCTNSAYISPAQIGFRWNCVFVIFEVEPCFLTKDRLGALRYTKIYSWEPCDEVRITAGSA